ncbi:MAG: hypothetical protein IPL27_26870 [Lewinellaceae bacterium]|nr:hypothetical protein [Lewinellaceae bacterium]
MQEHPLLIAFAQLIGDFFHSAANEHPLRETLLRRLAQALLQGQTSNFMRDTFQFERIRHYNTQYLGAGDRDYLNRILGEEQQAILPGQTQIKVFLREMPARATYLRSSIPAWARSAALTDSIGPVLNRDGRRFWLDIYTLVPDIKAIPDDVAQGADARVSQFRPPEGFELRLHQSTPGLTSVAGAGWNIYGEEKNFEWTQGPATFNYLFSGVSVPMTPDLTDLNIAQSLSPVLNLSGLTAIENAAWLLPAAEMGWPLSAEGAGMLSVRTKTGLLASCAGLLDVNQAVTAPLQINRCWVNAAAGQLQIIALETATEYATQTLRLWQDSQARWNDIRLKYPGIFPFIYQSNAAGTEALVSITNCEGKLDRPVGADQEPFNLQTKTSIYLRSYGPLSDYSLLYDENVIQDNQDPNDPAAGELTFQSRAIALNNALLTVSPINAFLLSGELSPQADTFIESSLLYAFALVGYLPALPDPYAADTGVFKWMHIELEGREGVYRLNNIQRLLIGAMHWQAAEAPGTSFIFGDLADSEANLYIHMNPMLDLQRSLHEQNNTRAERAAKAAARFSLHAGVHLGEQAWLEEYDVNIRVNDVYRNHHFFSLLDVSTAADWMGVNVGYLDEQFIFERRFEVVTDQNPLSADGMDVVATGRLVRLFTVPQISWEPVLNKAKATNVANDPPEGLLLFKDDGPPTLIGNTGSDTVPIAPLPVAEYLDEGYNNNPEFKAWSFFTLPFGMLGIARYNQEVTIKNNPPVPGATIGRLQEQFGGDIQTALQISTKGYLHPHNNRNFEGMTTQLYNLRSPLGQDLNKSILSATVTQIFNNEFGPDGGKLIQRGVPVERYDFSGYGANLFSHWVDPYAVIAQTSQAKFDVWRGRTAQEVIQVRSIVYPWGIRVVRTITMYRNSAALVYRIDSGWRAESDGVYDFDTVIDDGIVEKGYGFHAGIVKGVFNVRNIVESDDLNPFTDNWFKTTGYYINENNGLATLVGAGQPLEVDLRPVYFDADVQIDGIIQGGIDGRTPSKRMLGYLQVAPRGVPISAELFRNLLLMQNGLGGPVDCLIDIGESKQTMRLSRVEVQPSVEAGKIVFVTAAKGTPVLPKDGSWSVVAHKKSTGEVLPISNSVVPLIQRGLHPIANNNNPLELANPGDLFNLNSEDRATQYAFLQNTDTQKVLFRNPSFLHGLQQLQSSKPDLADAYRLLNSKGIFPKIGDLPRLDFNGFQLNINDAGYQLQNLNVPGEILQQKLEDKTIFFINEKDVKVYAEYVKKDKNGAPEGVAGLANFNLDSTAVAKQWTNKLDDVTMVVDLLDMKRLFRIRGKFDTEKGKAPGFTAPELLFSDEMQPVIDILQVLLSLSGGDYAGSLSKGLKIAMSNSPNNWEYKFQADKEIPVLRFPPAGTGGAIAPLRLEASLKLGCYFNVGMPYPEGGSPMPSGGAYLEFGGKLSVMCVSVAAATVYAVGSCVLRVSADTIRGPGLYMKIGFGVELVVGLPVIGNVSVYFAAGVEVSIDTRIIVVGAFILFRGRAELLAGLVTIQIQIEASGKVRRDLAAGRTDCIAQVTFSLDISIFLVINISFSKSFQENRQIA